MANSIFFPRATGWLPERGTIGSSLLSNREAHRAVRDEMRAMFAPAANNVQEPSDYSMANNVQEPSDYAIEPSDYAIEPSRTFFGRRAMASLVAIALLVPGCVWLAISAWEEEMPASFSHSPPTLRLPDAVRIARAPQQVFRPQSVDPSTLPPAVSTQVSDAASQRVMPRISATEDRAPAAADTTDTPRSALASILQSLPISVDEPAPGREQTSSQLTDDQMTSPPTVQIDTSHASVPDAGPPLSARSQQAKQITGSVSGKVTRRDLPRSAWRGHDRRSVVLDIHVASDGHVTGCRVVNSSGNSDLDAFTCNRVRSFYYDPARDAQGNAVAAVLRYRQDWWPESRRSTNE